MARPHLSTAPSHYPQEHPGLSTPSRRHPEPSHRVMSFSASSPAPWETDIALSPHMGRSRGPVRLRPVHRRPDAGDGRDGPAHDLAAPDASGQPQLPATPIGYGYDAAGERTSLRYPGGKTLGYAYYPDGQLKSKSVSSRPGVSNSSALRA